MWTAVKDVDIKMIFAVMDTSWAVVKISPKKNQTYTANVMFNKLILIWINLLRAVSREHFHKRKQTVIKLRSCA